MSKKLKLVAVSGGMQRPSRTLALVDAIVAQLAECVPLEVQVVELGEIAADLGATLDCRTASPQIASRLQAIETADALLVACPVFRGSYPGLFKHLFDLVHQDALVDMPVVLAATGGSERHALVLEHQLRPLFGFFQALALPIGVYASTRDFTGYEVTNDALRERIALAAQRAAPWLRVQRAPIASQPALAA